MSVNSEDAEDIEIEKDIIAQLDISELKKEDLVTVTSSEEGNRC